MITSYRSAGAWRNEVTGTPFGIRPPSVATTTIVTRGSPTNLQRKDREMEATRMRKR